ncbi:MAG: molybdenum cofactor biosynthesis protein MoaE [Pseudomonadota bacterium]|nr:molybdenum cofactor biosynthesis protein MoaE [Pseudomonadota bacterium]
MRIEIRPRVFDPWRALMDYQAAEHLEAGGYGATAVFVGTMRDFNEGEAVSAMTLEHYPGMTERQLEKLAAGAIEEYGLLDALIVHRVGRVEPHEAIVLVAVWSAHRAEAFRACREMMEVLKTRAPFWKKETLAGGERWVEKNTAG